MAGDYEVFTSILSQYGVVEAKDEFELIAFAEALSCYQKPIEGRIGIITGAGSRGVSRRCLFVSRPFCPLLSEQDQNEIREKISPRIQAIASLSNPIDLTGASWMTILFPPPRS